MRKFVSIVLIFSWLGCSSVIAQNDITMMSYNIKGGAIDNTKFANMVKVINNHQPEVVALQEVHLRPYLLFRDYLKELAEATGMYYEFLPTVSNYYGIGLLSRTKPLSVKTKIIPLSDASKDKENRGMIIAEFADYFFISTHYSLNANDRDAATEYILRFTDDASKTVFVAGDFNAQPTYKAMVTFKNYGYVILNNTQTYTFPSDKPNVCIDMIISYSAFEEAKKYRVVGGGIAVTPDVNLANTSDHLPIFIKLHPSASSGLEEDFFHKVSIVPEGNALRVTGLEKPSLLSIYTLGGQLLEQQTVLVDGLITLSSVSRGETYVVTLRNGLQSHSIKLMFNN